MLDDVMKKIRKILILTIMLSLILCMRMMPVKAAALKSPAGNKLTVKSYNSLLLKWEKVPGASGYAVWRRTAGNSFERIAVLSGVSKCRYVDKELSTGTKYVYMVKAYKKSGQKIIWSAAGKSLAAVPKLSKPVVRFVKVNGPGELVVTWEKIPGANGYFVYRAAAKNGSYKRIKTLVGKKKISYTDTGLSAGKRYYYKIKAYRTEKKKNFYSDTSEAKGGKTEDNVAVTEIRLEKEYTLNIQQTIKLTPVIIPSNATDKTVIWSSSDPGVVSVKDGSITGIAVGEAVITVQSGNGKNARCKVTVNLPKEREALLYEIIEKGCREKTGLHFDASLNIVKPNDYIDISALGYSNESAEDKALVYRTYQKVFYDHPEFFYLAEGIYRYGPQGMLKGIIPMYCSFAKNAENLDIYEREMEAAVTQALKCTEKITDPVEQLLALYDYIAENTLYNWKVATNNRKDAADYAWTAYGQLVKHDAVCKGEAMSYKLLVDRLNNPRIKCMVVGSKEMDHVWNIVTIDGRDSYHIDVNRSINNVPTLRGKAVHSGFLLSDEKARENNYCGWAESSPYDTVPSCSSKKYESDYIFNDLDFPVYRKDGVYYYLKQNGYKKYVLCCGGLTGAGRILAKIPILTRDFNGKYFHIASGVVWRNDVFYYVNENLMLVGYQLLTGESRILGNIAFTYQPSPDDYYGEEDDGIGLYFDESAGEIAAVSRTRRIILGRFKIKAI